jgi:type II secretory pathway component PulL
MARSAFIDLHEGGGEVYVYGPPPAGGGPAPFDRIAFTLGEGGFRPETPMGEIEECVLGLPAHLLNYRVLTLPVGDRARARELLPFELDGLVLGPVSALAIDALPLGEATAPGVHRVLAVSARTDTLGGLLSALRSAGLDPHAVTSLDLRAALAGDEGDIESRLALAPELPAERRPEFGYEELARPTVDLRTGTLAYTRETRRLERLVVLAASLLTLILLVTALGAGLRLSAANLEAKRTEKELIALYAQTFPGEKPVAAQGLLYKARAALKERQTAGRTLAGAHPLDTLVSLQAARPPGVVLTRFSIDGDGLLIEGDAGAPSEVEELRQRLARGMADVRITQTGQSPAGKTSFAITAITTGEGGK